MHAVKEAFVVIRAVLTDQLIADAAAGLLLDKLLKRSLVVGAAAADTGKIIMPSTIAGRSGG